MKLEDIPKKQPVFDIPEDYFENLPHKVMRRIKQPRRRSLSMWLAYAACLALLLMGIGIGYDHFDVENDKLGSWQTIEEVLLENDISEAELLELHYMSETIQDPSEIVFEELLYEVSEEEIMELAY
ncbi:MAG: hypothetical protein RMJ44_00270 [Cytophagales bacterium]|nr:hypothetical protein [Bernardetiaceae bacterium]MDW8209493.1 hypothetical protein [Cytophagales bacterium]